MSALDAFGDGCIAGIVMIVGGCVWYAGSCFRAWRRRVRRQQVRLRAVVTLRRLRLVGWRAGLRRGKTGDGFRKAI